MGLEYSSLGWYASWDSSCKSAFCSHCVSFSLLFLNRPRRWHRFQALWLVSDFKLDLSGGSYTLWKSKWSFCAWVSSRDSSLESTVSNEVPSGIWLVGCCISLLGKGASSSSSWFSVMNSKDHSCVFPSLTASPMTLGAGLMHWEVSIWAAHWDLLFISVVIMTSKCWLFLFTPSFTSLLPFPGVAVPVHVPERAKHTVLIDWFCVSVWGGGTPTQLLMKLAYSGLMYQVSLGPTSEQRCRPFLCQENVSCL